MAGISIQTLDQRAAVIRQRLLQLNGNSFALSPGADVTDLFEIPQAVSDVRQNAISYLNAVANSILDVLALEQDSLTVALIAQALNTTSADIQTRLSALIDDWGGNFNETRKQPQAASGTILYGRQDAPTSDLTINIGKLVTSSGGIQYQTTAAVTMYAAQAGSYFDTNLLLYVIEVPIAAVNVGANGNTSANTVSQLTTSVTGFQFVTNPNAIIGGTDLESDSDFGNRVIAKWQAIGVLTQAGVSESVVTALPSIEDVYVAKTGDALSVRGNGKTDVWIKGTTVSQITETFAGYNNPDFPGSVIPTKHPILSLVGVDSGVAVLRQDASSAVSGSVQAKDCIQFTTAPAFPVQITYSYDSKVGDAQAVFNDISKAPLNQEDVVDVITAVRAPILTRRGLALEFDYTVVIMVVPGQSAPTVKANAQAAVTAFAANYKFSETGFRDDLNKIVEATAGVLRIASESLFAVAGQTGLADSITTATNQYLTPRNINIF